MLTTGIDRPWSIPDDQTVPSCSPGYSCPEQVIGDHFQGSIKFSWPQQETQTVGQPGQNVLVEKTYENTEVELLQEAVFERLATMDELIDLLNPEEDSYNEFEAPVQLGSEASFSENLSPQFQNLEVVKIELEDSYGGQSKHNTDIPEVALGSAFGEIGHETETSGLTASEIFNQIQGFGSVCSSGNADAMSSAFTSCSDTSTDSSGSPKYVPSSDGSVTSDTDWDFLCSDMDGEMSTPLTASGNERAKLCMTEINAPEIGTVAIGQQNVDFSSSILPKFPDLLGEQTQNNAVKANNFISETRSFRTRQAKQDPDWVNMDDSDAVNYDDNDTDDDNFIPRKYKDLPKKKKVPTATLR